MPCEPPLPKYVGVRECAHVTNFLTLALALNSLVKILAQIREGVCRVAIVILDRFRRSVPFLCLVVSPATAERPYQHFTPWIYQQRRSSGSESRSVVFDGLDAPRQSVVTVSNLHTKVFADCLQDGALVCLSTLRRGWVSRYQKIIAGILGS